MTLVFTGLIFNLLVSLNISFMYQYTLHILLSVRDTVRCNMNIISHIQNLTLCKGVVI